MPSSQKKAGFMLQASSQARSMNALYYHLDDT